MACTIASRAVESDVHKTEMEVTEYAVTTVIVPVVTASADVRTVTIISFSGYLPFMGGNEWG